MQAILDQITQLVGAYVPNLLGAIAILILGWILALIIGAVVRGIFKKTSLDRKLSAWIAGEEKEGEIPVAKIAGKIAFWVALLFVLIAFFQTLGLTMITQPLNQLLTEIFVFAPQILAAVLLLFLAWVLASVARLLLTKVLGVLKLDERLGESTDKKEMHLSATIGNVVYWIIFLLFLPAIIGALQLQGLLGPVQGMVDEILNALPDIFTAGLIIVVGWFVASIIRRVTSNLLEAVGLNKLSDRVGVATVLGKQKLSAVVAYVLYVLILIPIIVSGLNALSLDAITRPATNMLNMIMAALPMLFAASLIIIVSLIVGKVVSRLVANFLNSVGFDNLSVKLGLQKETKENTQASDFAGYLTLIAIVFFAAMEALRMLQFENMANLLFQFVEFAGHVLLGLVIFGIGLFFSNLVAKKVKESKAAQANWLAMLSRVAILVLAGAMALQQMGFGEDIILIAFGLSVGSIAIAAAIAFGIGGRDIASEQLREWTQKLKS